MVIEQPSHSCKLCGKSFWNRDSMYKHMNMHKGTTQCPVCHKVLSRTTHMKRHLKNRHGWLGVGTTASASVVAAGVPVGGVGTTASASVVAAGVPVGGVETPVPISSTAAITQQNAGGSPTGIDANATFTTIRIRESSVERITSSPIP